MCFEGTLFWARCVLISRALRLYAKICFLHFYSASKYIIQIKSTQRLRTSLKLLPHVVDPLD